MAILISRANGNWTDATGVWGVVESGSGAIQTNIDGGAESHTNTAYQYSVAFTCTNADVLDGILLRLKALGATGTVTFALSDDGGTTATREVTINASDLPTDYTYVLIKFGSTLTADGGNDYKIGLKVSSGGSGVSIYASGTAYDYWHMVSTTATTAIAAGDTPYIVGELTGAGTGNDFAVTMNNTDTTDYGAIELGKRGTLSYGITASTNYYLKTSGVMNVWAGATLSIGTSANPIPRTGTAVLEFDPTTDGEFGLNVKNKGTFNSQGLSRTVGKNIYFALLNTNEAANSTDLGVDTDTGWLDNDEIVVASTTKTVSQCEKGTLNGNAGASSLTVDGFGGDGGGLAYAHSGTTPTQAHVINITRNVKIRSATSTIMTYIRFEGTSVVDMDWTEIYYVGENASSKKGIDIATTTGSLSIEYCSLHDTEDYGLYMNGSTVNNVTIRYNVGYNLNTVLSSTDVGGFYWGSNTSGTSNIMDNNIIIRAGGTGAGPSCNCFFIVDPDLQFNGNVGIGANDDGLKVNNNANGGTFGISTAVNEFYCNGQKGATISQGAKGWTWDYMKCWRNGAGGIQFNDVNSQNSVKNVILKNLTCFGNNGYNIIMGSCASGIVLDTVVCAGDTTYGTDYGIDFQNGRIVDMKIINSTFGVASGIYVAHSSADIVFDGGNLVKIEIINSKLASSVEIASLTNLLAGAIITSQKHDQTAGLHKAWKMYGIISIDTTADMYRTASPSERLTPNTASLKLESGSKKVAVANGQTVTPSVYIRESVSGDGTDYNGNRVRLIVKRNDAMGITADTVLATATISSEGAFELLTGTTATVTDDGVLEFVVDCDGTTGWVNVDDWSVA